jgi:hypothetical protein
VPATVVGGQPLTITWSAATDVDGNLSGYTLERQNNASGTWTQIYSGSALSYSDTITKGWTSVQYRVKAYDSAAAASGYTTSTVRTVDNNTPPTVSSSSSGDLGTKNAGFSISYTVNDVDGDAVTVVEAIDGVTKRSYAATLGANNSFAVTGTYFQQLLNGKHTMTVTATDSGGKSGTLTLTFTKAVYSLSITLETPLAADDLITKAVINITRSIPADATFQVLLTNNALDPSPVWEDVTANVTNGLNHVFANTTAVNGNAFNFQITASRGASNTGGYISTIGGAFE